VPKSLTSLSQVNAQIEKLQQQAEALKAKEVNGVIARMKEAIRHYGITAADLGLSKSRGAKAGVAGKTAAKKARKTSARKGTGVARYRSPDGERTWTGHGRAPAWFKDALDAGASRESLEVK
jgi:DNA-binding protein H-NS